ncbi:EAL domain-containing protein [Leptothoe sp. ISB3NOV94-8A]
MKSALHYPSDSHLHNLSALVQHELQYPLRNLQGVIQKLSSGQLGQLSGEDNQLLQTATLDLDRLIRLAKAVKTQPTALTALLSPKQARLYQLRQDLPIAIKNQEINLVYQPIICSKTETVYGFEALARWHHPTYGLICPTIFIPLTEEEGVIHQMGQQLTTIACHQLCQWQQAFPQPCPLTMSVNLSALQLTQLVLAEHVEYVLATSQIAPNTLKLEITESALVENDHVVAAVVQKLINLGVKFHLDDFGTGYSALSRLKSFPLNALKVDRSFVSKKEWDICEIIYALGEKLNLNVIVEGIETHEDFEKLKGIGFRYMQGHYFSRPLTADDAANFLSGFCLSVTPNHF